jgi:fibronectin type III domain protein
VLLGRVAEVAGHGSRDSEAAFVVRLKAFAKVRLAPGQSTQVVLEFDDRSFACWDPDQADWDEVAGRFTAISPQVVAHDRRVAGWQIDPGTYRVLIGPLSADIVAEHRVEVADTGDSPR